MNVIVQSKDLEITRALREFIERQAGKFKKFSSLRVNQVGVYLEQKTKRGSDDKKVLVKYKIEIPGKDLWVEIDGHDFYDAIVDATKVALQKLSEVKAQKVDYRRLA